MKSTAKSVLATVLVLAAAGAAFTHCEIPCGIYGDQTRITLLYEDVQTVEKSMEQIRELSGKNDAQSINQVVRWVSNKDAHASKIQETVTQYFMTQRVKPKDAGEDQDRYLQQITALHGMLVQAMKAKQTVDSKHCEKLRKLIDQFSAAYFSEEDLKHIREHHGEPHDGDHK
ncbi:MAG: superoxide dismutase [Ni] [Planctomycetota bacterium JB042]